MKEHRCILSCGTVEQNISGCKDYETGAEMFEKSMLYVPHNVENKILRTKCFRVLSLCHLAALLQFDRAQEYITEREKLQPNIVCAFFKVLHNPFYQHSLLLVCIFCNIEVTLLFDLKCFPLNEWI